MRILVLRRDNIGDLVCTTPLIRALRARFPEAEIHALVNSYTAPVLDGLTELDAVHAYTKLKHRAPGESIAGAYLRRLALLWRLRRKRFDWAILAAPGDQPRLLFLARWLAPRHILGFVTDRPDPHIDTAVPYGERPALHEARDVFRLLAPLGIDGEPPAARLVANPARRAIVTQALQSLAPEAERTVAVHISARKPSQRWPAERFAELMQQLAARQPLRFVLLWSPGEPDNPMHCGDDAKAAAVQAALPAGFPLLPRPTHALADLVAALDACDLMICSDGGAMHLAAGLGKPVVCLFGRSEAVRWHPWGVPYRLLQPESREVTDVPVTAVAEAFAALTEPSAFAPPPGSTCKTDG